GARGAGGSGWSCQPRDCQQIRIQAMDALRRALPSAPEIVRREKRGWGAGPSLSLGWQTTILDQQIVDRLSQVFALRDSGAPGKLAQAKDLLLGDENVSRYDPLHVLLRGRELGGGTSIRIRHPVPPR